MTKKNALDSLHIPIAPISLDAPKVAPIVAQFPPDMRLHIRQMLSLRLVRRVFPCPTNGCEEEWCFRAGAWIVIYDHLQQQFASALEEEHRDL